MKKEIRKIKRSSTLLPSLIFFSLMLTVLSVFCLLLPNIKDMGGETMEFIFYAVGGVGTICFSFTTFNFIFQLKNPKNALIICEDGFLELTFAGQGGGYIPWDNIKDIKTFSVNKIRFLGISLHETAELLEEAPAGVRRKIQSNQGEGKPEVVICQSDLSITVAEVMELFKKHSQAYFNSKKDSPSVFTETQPFDIAAQTKVLNLADIVIKEEKPISEEANNEDMVKTAETVIPEDKSIDELLAELSASVKSRTETQKEKDSGKVAKDLEELIKLLKDKKPD